MKILVTGGTGYIGSHTAIELLNNNYEVVIIDNLSNSKREVVDKIKKITGKDVIFYEGDVCDKKLLEEIFNDNKIDAVISEISARTTTLGAAQNRIESAVESINVQSENITSSLSTLRDADVAEESSNYIKAQILQQASATLLATANQTPSIALNLL